MPGTIKNILVRRVDNLGDMILVMPALRIIRDHFKNATITLMVKPGHKALLKHLADDFINPVAVKDLQSLADKYDHIINIEYSLPQNYRIIPGSLPKIFHIGTPDWKRERHVSRHLADGVKAWGIKGRYRNPLLPLNEDAKKAAAEWLRKNKIRSSANLVISIDPNSGFEKKAWSLKGFVEVATYLVNEFDAYVIIPVASADDERALRIKDNLPAAKCLLLAGQPLDVVAAVLKKCDLHVGNDSGIGHLASAVNTPTVTIFGPTDPVLWKPCGKKSVVIVKNEIHCPGGYEHALQCRIQKCLVSITAKDVIDGILYAFSKYVNYEKIFSSANLMLSDHIYIRKTSRGYILQNNITRHACIVKNGWLNVKRVLSEIKDSTDIRSYLQRQPHQKPLIDMLFVHRLLEPCN